MDGVVLAALATGLFGSAHCVAMCGGIVGALSGGISPDLRRRPRAHVGLVAAYNVGRVASYAAGGALFGLLAFGLRDAVAHAQLVLRALAGALMLGLGLYLVGLFPRFASLEKLGAPVYARVSPVARRLLPVRTAWHALGLGVLWGWVPCGMVYTSLALATAAASPLRGALVMVAFGLGTLPSMLLSGTLAGHLASGLRSAWVRRVAGVLVATFGVMSIVFAGVALAAPTGPVSPAPVACHPSP